MEAMGGERPAGELRGPTSGLVSQNATVGEPGELAAHDFRMRWDRKPPQGGSPC